MRFRNLEVYITPGIKELFRRDIGPVLVLVDEHWHEFFDYEGFVTDVPRASHDEYFSLFEVEDTKIRVSTIYRTRVTTVEKIIDIDDLGGDDDEV